MERQHDYLIFHHAVTRLAQSAIRRGNQKLTKTWKEGPVEFFDLSRDLSESKDLSRSMPQLRDERYDLLGDFLKAANAETGRTTTKAELSELFR